MDESKLNPNDVIKPDANFNLIGYLSGGGSEIFTADKLTQLFENNFGETITPWLSDEGVECEVIRANRAQGWEKGKIRIKIEFIPND